MPGRAAIRRTCSSTGCGSGNATSYTSPSVRRLVQDQADENVGHAHQQVQCREDEPGHQKTLDAAPSGAVEFGDALLALYLGCGERKLDVHQLAGRGGGTRRYCLKPHRGDPDADVGESSAHLSCPSTAEYLIPPRQPMPSPTPFVSP